MAQLKPYEDNPHFYLWKYVPSIAASIVFAGLFILATLWIMFRSVRARALYPLAMIVGGLMEIVGFLARAYCEKHTDKLMPYAIQLVLILIAPALFAASIYMTLSRVMRSIDAERHSIIPIRWLTKIFVLGDVLSFVIQLGGGSLSTKTDINPDIPKYMIIIGLVIQILFFGLFMVTSFLFHLRIRREPTNASQHPQTKWRSILNTLYVTSALILLRSVFRLIEYIAGDDSYLFKHEWPLFVFDCVPMFITMVVFGIWFPGNLKTAPGAGAFQKPVPMYGYDSSETQV